MGSKSDLSPETQNAQALGQIDSLSGGITPAIQPSTTFLRDENYQLIEPVRIGPVTAPNRFYCAPHAQGTGQQRHWRLQSGGSPQLVLKGNPG